MMSVDNDNSGPFAQYVQPAPSIHAVKLTAENYNSVVRHIVNLVSDSVSVTLPRGRGALVVGAVRFDLGEWIVQEYNFDTFSYSFRPATEEEVKTYRLF